MLREPARDEETRTGLTESQVVEPVAYREQMLKERRKTEVAEGKKSTFSYSSVPATKRGGSWRVRRGRNRFSRRQYACYQWCQRDCLQRRVIQIRRLCCSYLVFFGFNAVGVRGDVVREL